MATEGKKMAPVNVLMVSTCFLSWHVAEQYRWALESTRQALSVAGNLGRTKRLAL